MNDIGINNPSLQIYNENGIMPLFSNQKIRDSNIKITKNTINIEQDQRAQHDEYEQAKNLSYRKQLEEFKQRIKGTIGYDNYDGDIEDDNYVTSQGKEMIRKLQEERERYLLGERTNESPKRPYVLDNKDKELIRKYQQLREDEALEQKYIESKHEEKRKSLGESNKIVTSVKGSFNLNKKNIASGFESLLEQKPNMLDQNLDNKSSMNYLSNRELIKYDKQKKDKQYNEDEDEDQSSSEFENLYPKKQIINIDNEMKANDQFKKAMLKKEKKMKHENIKKHEKRIGNDQSTFKNMRPQSTKARPESSSLSISKTIGSSIGGDGIGANIINKNSLFEIELEKLKEENDNIRRQLKEMKRQKSVIESMTGSKFPYNEINKGTIIGHYTNKDEDNEFKLMRTTAEKQFLKERRDMNHANAIRDMIGENDEVLETVYQTKNRIRASLNQNERSQSINSRQGIAHAKSTKKFKFRGWKDQVRMKYYGYVAHCQSCTLLLSRGLPTSHCSEHGNIIGQKDGNKDFPKRFQNLL